MAEEIAIEREVVFRDRDWGCGMFDANDVRCVVMDGRIWLMRGTTHVRITNDDLDDGGLDAAHARSIGMILIAAADEVEAEGRP